MIRKLNDFCYKKMRLEKKMLKNILALIFITASCLNIASAIELEFENPFTIELTVYSVFTEDGKTYRISASGNAGPYGRAYSSWVFTDKLEMGDKGEFSGIAGTQVGEDIFEASIQGVYVKTGSVFKVYSLDIVSDNKLQMKVGQVDLVKKTMKFEVSDIVP